MAASYDSLADKSGIEPQQMRFPGYDGNNESDLRYFTGALAADGRYADTIGSPPKNSHSPMASKYAAMVAAWTDLGKPRYPLSKEQILEILEAKNSTPRLE